MGSCSLKKLLICEPAVPCPESAPYPVDHGRACCHSNMASGNCTGKEKGSPLEANDPVGCCSKEVTKCQKGGSCQERKNVTGDDAFVKKMKIGKMVVFRPWLLIANCDEGHPYPFNEGASCCANRFRAENCSAGDSGTRLEQTDPLECCNDPKDCEKPTCIGKENATGTVGTGTD